MTKKNWQKEFVKMYEPVVEIMRAGVRDEAGNKVFGLSDSMEALLKLGAPEDAILKAVVFGSFIGLLNVLSDVPNAIHAAEALQDMLFGEEEGGENMSLPDYIA